jgi:hypothetical protein
MRIKEKGDEEGCMERKGRIGNKWWKIVTIYGKEMKTTRRRRRRNERKQGRLYVYSWEGTSTGEQEKEQQEIGKKRSGMGKENPKTRWENAEEKRLMEWIEENGWIVNEEA